MIEGGFTIEINDDFREWIGRYLAQGEIISVEEIWIEGEAARPWDILRLFLHGNTAKMKALAASLRRWRRIRPLMNPVRLP